MASLLDGWPLAEGRTAGDRFRKQVEHDPAWSVWEIDAGLFGEWRRGLEDLVGDRRHLVSRGRPKDTRRGCGFGSDAPEKRYAAASRRCRLGWVADQCKPIGDGQVTDQVCDVGSLQNDAVALADCLVEHV